LSARRARLSRLVEGESLLNDAAAITLFVLLLEMMVAGHPIQRRRGVVVVVRNFLGGIAAGYVGGRLIVGVLPWLRDMRLAQVTLTLALPYLVFIVGERMFEVSGVVAAVTAGLVMTAVASRVLRRTIGASCRRCGSSWPSGRVH